MIAFLQGVLIERERRRDNSGVIIVDVHGVGYEVAISARVLHDLAPLHSPIALSVYTHMREGSITLYGFSNNSERRLFELLLNTHGVGPQMALAILGSLSESELVHAVVSGDIKALTAVVGVGTKTAQRLILELAQKLEAVDGAAPIHDRATSGDDVRTEVREALGSLGYGSDEIRAVLAEISTADSTESLLREALVQLAPRR